MHVWGFTKEAADVIEGSNLIDETSKRQYGQVLGNSLGRPGRKEATPEELARIARAKRKARRVQRLPASQRFRREVAVATAGMMRAWSHLPNGRQPTSQEASSYTASMRGATVG